jgi:HEAT repeat protein
VIGARVPTLILLALALASIASAGDDSSSWGGGLPPPATPPGATAPLASLVSLGASHAAASDPAERGRIEAAMARLPLEPSDLVAALRQAEPPAARAFAAWALGRVGTVAAAEALLAGAADPDDAVRAAAYASLGRGAGAGAIDRLVVAAVRDPSVAGRAAAAAAAEALAGADVEWAEVDADLAVLSDAGGDPFGRAGAARRLGDTGDRRALAPLLSALDASEPTLARAAAAALGRLGDWRATDALVTRLRGARGRTRYELLGALATLGDPAAVEPVAALLDDGDAATRQLALRSLALIAPPDLYARIVPRADDPSEDVRAEVLWIASNVSSTEPARAEVLARLAADASPFVRAEAIRLCTELAPPPASVVEALPRMLRDADPLVRLAAADAIVALGRAEAAPAVRAAAGRARSDAERERLEGAATQLDGLRKGRSDR